MGITKWMDIVVAFCHLLYFFFLNVFIVHVVLVVLVGKAGVKREDSLQERVTGVNLIVGCADGFPFGGARNGHGRVVNWPV